MLSALSIEMTKLLEKAFSEAQKLPDHDQDVLASVIIEEMLAERKWDDAFANSQDRLDKLADEVERDITVGRTKPLSF
jgi:hypothetical protein